MTYLNHLTINTGDLRRSLRGEVADHVITHTRALLDEALERRTAMPIPGYEISAKRYGRALVATIWGGDDPLATLAIAPRDRDGRAMWRDLMVQVTRVWPDMDCDAPPAPYAATVLWPAVSLEADAAAWIGDFGRCAGWAWLEISR